MTKLQKLTKAIQTANPSIMKLEFGCEVEYDYKGKIEKQIIKGKGYEQTDSKSLMREYGCHSSIDSFSVDNFELLNYPYVSTKKEYEKYKELWEHTYPITKILGKPINLENCLVAIDKTDITKCEQYKNENWTMPEFAGHIVLKLIDAWKFDKSLENQETKTINLLHDLICKK